MLKTYYIKRTTKKTIRTILVLGVLLQGIFGSCLSVKATEISLEQNVIVDGSILTDDSISEKVLYNRTRGNILNRGVARITNNGNGSVNVYGAVLPAVKCDTLTLKMTIQRLENGSWAPTCGKLMTELISKLKNTEIIGSNVMIKSAVKADKTAELDSLAKAIADSI